MSNREANRKSFYAVRTLLACAVALSASVVHAQTFSELQTLAFYPVPLGSAATAPVVAAACNCPDMVGSGGMGSARQAVPSEAAPVSYLRNLVEIQNHAESYAPELARQQTDEGLLQQQQNQHEAAVLSFERAAAASRIHDGLYSSEQIFLTEHTINSLVALGRLDEAEDKYSQLLDTSRKFHGPGAVQTAHALLGLGQLQVERLQQNLARSSSVDDSYDTLYEIQTHFVDAIRILIDNEAWTDPAILALEQNLVRTYYIDATLARTVDTPLSYARDDETGFSRMQSRANRAGLPEQYHKGKQAYLRMIGYLKKDPNVDVAAIADAMQGLGDWNLLFGNQAEAEETYRQLAEIMALAGADPAEAAAILHPAVPVTVPAFVDSALSPDAMSETSDSRGYVDVSFNVDRHGHATNLDVLGASDGTDSAVVGHLEKLVRNAQFRPGVDANADYSLRYYFSN